MTPAPPTIRATAQLAAPPSRLSTGDARELTLYQLHRPEVIADPWPYYRRLHTAGLVWDRYTSCWLAPRHAQVTAVLTDPRFTTAMRHDDRLGPLVPDEPSTRRVLRLLDHHVSFVDGDQHTRLRAALAAPLRPGRVRALHTLIADIVTGAVDTLVRSRAGDRPDGALRDLVAEVAAPVPLRVIRHLLGLHATPLDALRLWSTTWGDVIAAPGHLPTRDRARTMATVDELLAALVAVVAAQRRGELDAPITGALVRARAAGLLDEDEVLANLMMLVTAGNETTTNLISNALCALLEDPALWDRLAADQALLPAAVDELARLFPPTQYTARTASTDVELDGHVVRAGQTVVLLLAAANRDPDVFVDPDVVRLDRPAVAGGRPVTFGSGRHACFGAPLAALETRLVLAGMLDRLGGRRPVLAGAVVWRRNGNLRGLQHLPVRLPAVRVSAVDAAEDPR